MRGVPHDYDYFLNFADKFSAKEEENYLLLSIGYYEVGVFGQFPVNSSLIQSY